jgi:hypothetical protein
MNSKWKREQLLLVVFDDIWGTNLRLIRVPSELAQRPALAKQVPILVELDLYLL